MLRKIFQDKKNYYNILIAIFFGIILIMLSDGFIKKDEKQNKTEPIPQKKMMDKTYEKKLEQELEQILMQVQNVGKVEVMMTFENGKEIVTKNDMMKEKATTNEEALNGDKRQIVSNKSQKTTVKVNGDEPLIVKEINPKVLGILIVAQGGGNVEVKSTIINATKAVFDIDINKIQVLEMK